MGFKKIDRIDRIDRIIDKYSFYLALEAEVHNTRISENFDESYTPETHTIIDLIQFCYHCVAEPSKKDYHAYFSHHHLEFNIDNGKKKFLEKINQIFSRNGIVYELNENGDIIRIVNPIIENLFINTIFNTNDPTLNDMLEDAKNKYLNNDPKIRREALNQLCDCLERIKTLENHSNKKDSIKKLLNKISEQNEVLDFLESEVKDNLTGTIANKFFMRHSEHNQIRVDDSDVLDYFFHRMFAMIWLLLKKTLV